LISFLVLTKIKLSIFSTGEDTQSFITMNDLQTINEIIGEAVRNSSYITVIISSCIFIIYTLIIKIVEVIKQKDKNKPLLQMAASFKDVSENVVKLNQVLDKIFHDAEAKEASRITNVIIANFNSFKSAIISQCIDIILHNNIDKNKDSIRQNLYKTVNTEYYKLYSNFSAYEHDNTSISTKLKEEWIEEITNDCLKVIYNGEDAANRIRQIDNKISLNTEQYSIFINNKVFNH